ncbi:cysteinyl leukotriene receptor 1-like [Polyodon spathula]|uniref:cysteinyl leukotriene receptor 1-like n=1 Tax=Polyodon spathula TaxID=7913 RepID=UPI001B7DDE90|nr:cysteinyl leukotriene receptor 1-like [Polyodon spathula]
MDWLEGNQSTEGGGNFSSGNQSCGNSDGFKYTVYLSAYSVIFPVGLITNSLALYVFLRLTPNKTPNTVFTINLATSDLFFALTLPYRIIYYSREGSWGFPDWLCRVCTFAFYVNLYSSILFLTALSVSRYVAVLHPMKTRTLITVRRALATSLVIWALVSLSSTPFLLSGTHPRGGKTRCFEPRNLGSWKRILIMNYVALVLGFLAPFLTILGCYWQIIWRLTQAGKNLGQDRPTPQHQRSIHLIAFVLTAFLFCFLPYHVQRTVHLHTMQHPGKDCAGQLLAQKIVVVTVCLAAANSCLNPLLYYFVGRAFRSSVSRVTYRRGGLRGRGASRQSASSFSLLFRRGSLKKELEEGTVVKCIVHDIQ